VGFVLLNVKVSMVFIDHCLYFCPFSSGHCMSVLLRLEISVISLAFLNPSYETIEKVIQHKGLDIIDHGTIR
jgi:hypothetical protein